eukprot:PhM_4_TR3359/c0_g1_i1/m.87506
MTNTPPNQAGGPSGGTFSSISTAVNVVTTAKRMKERLYDYEVIVEEDSTTLPLEVVETEDYFYIALEIPGLTSIRDIHFEFSMLQLGHLVTVTTEIKSAVGEGVVPMKQPISKRLLGGVSWKAVVKGVFEGRPECNYKYGVFKLRLKKRSQKEEAVDLVDF